jgi:hypothetical protein
MAETVHRPWGTYTVLDDASTHKVKRIEVLPGKRLSYQKHFRRSEHWMAVAGRAKVTLNDREIGLNPGDTVDIPVGAWHRIENPKHQRFWSSSRFSAAIISAKTTSSAPRMILDGPRRILCRNYLFGSPSFGLYSFSALCVFPQDISMLSDKEIRLLYGKGARISRKGSFALVHLDQPSAKVIRDRTVISIRTSTFSMIVRYARC